MNGLPRPLRSAVSFLKTAFVSDGSFLITALLFIWVTYDALATHRERPFSQGAGVRCSQGAGVRCRRQGPQPRPACGSHFPHFVPV